MDPDQEKLLKEEEERKKKMSKIARIKCFGTDKKFAAGGGKITKSKTPGPIYDVTDQFKYKKASHWKIGTGNRSDLVNGEKYDHYDHLYDERYDFSAFDKIWDKVPGGAISLEPRIKYDFREGNPGPGRYEPEVGPIKTKAPAYFLGEKSNNDVLKLNVGTNDLIGPGAYKPENSKKPSKHTEYPHWTLPKSERKGLNDKVWTKNETYAVVSSVGTQQQSKKTTEPRVKIGKSTRDKTKKLGMFPTMMSKQPTRIRIDHPKL